MLALLTPVLFFGQPTSKCFKAQNELNINQGIYREFFMSDSILLTSSSPIYALCINASIFQPSLGSFARVVLVDSTGDEYLVAESDQFRNDTAMVDLSEYCEETSNLNGVYPSMLKLYLYNATITINNILMSSRQSNETKGRSSFKELRKKQVEDIINRINLSNIRHHRLWRAGVNDLALMNYKNSKRIRNTDGIDAFTTNLAYYKGGIYELGELDSMMAEGSSLYVDSFDWSQKHGKDWITSAKDQGTTLFCQTLAVVGMTEATTNLYYNSLLNLDLSEQDVLSRVYNSGSWAYLIASITDIIHNGIIDEDALPFNGYAFNPSVIDPRPEGNERISFNSYTLDFWSTNSSPEIESVKQHLISYGPCAAGILTSAGGHAIMIFGYNRIQAGQSFLLDEENNIWSDPIASNDERIGYTYWKFKNSWGPNWGNNGRGCLICYDYNLMREYYFISSAINSTIRSSSDIVCEDSDGDGYFNWGIGTRPAHCPSYAPYQRDGDDSNPRIGPVNRFGKCQNIDPDSMNILIIENDTTFFNEHYIGSHIVIRNNSTLTLSGRLVMNHISHITIESGSVLNIDGGILQYGVLEPEAGGAIIINNDGEIQTYKDQDFIIPLGATFSLLQGEIKKHS